MPSSRSRSNSTIGSLTHDAPGEYLQKRHPNELVKAILSLRRENEELCQLKIPPRSSSQAKDQSPGSSIPSRQPCESQQGEFPRTARGLDSANKKLRELQLERDELKTRVKEAEEKAEQELRQERANVAEAKRQVTKTLTELAAATRTEGNLYDDNHFRGEVTRLRFLVKNWVKNESWRAVDEQDPSPNLKPYQFLKPICNNYEEYVHLQFQSELGTLVEAYIWAALAKRIFGRFIWAESRADLSGPDGRSTSNNPFSAWKEHIVNALDHAMENNLYHDWRVANARLIAKTDSDSIKKAVRMVTEVLASGLVVNLKHIAENDLDVPGLEDLFHTAVQLDALMQQQRPYYEFYPYPISTRGLRFDMKTMDFANTEIDSRTSEQSIVKLVVQPRLMKWGNSAGKNYDKGITLLKGTVE